MRALVYTDLQATDGHERSFKDPTQSLQINRVQDFYADLLRIFNEHQCDCLWDLGDTLDDRSAIPVPAIDAVCDALLQFPQHQWNLKLIGNHEQFLRNTKVNVGKMFAPYFSVVPNNKAYTLNGVRILCCSYPACMADTMQWIEQQKALAQKAKQKVILLGHFAVMGCMTGDGRLLAGIPKESVSWVDLGLLGHIHKPQSVSKRVHYVGSPFQQNWGEAGEDKRVAIVDISMATVEWVPLVGFPTYALVGLEEFKEVCTAETEDRFKVVLKSQAEAATFYANPLAHRAEPVYEFIEETEEAQADGAAPVLGHRWSFDSVVQRYVERFTPDACGLPMTIEEMVGYGKEIALH